MSGRKPRDFSKNSPTRLIWGFVILSLLINVVLLVMFLNIDKDGKDGKDGKNGIDGKDGELQVPDHLIIKSLTVMDSLETYGTVDLYAAEQSDSRRLLSTSTAIISETDHCSTCENIFSDSKTCLSRCNSHIKLEKNGFNEIFHVCCK
jgi:hypothetical protein